MHDTDEQELGQRTQYRWNNEDIIQHYIYNPGSSSRDVNAFQPWNYIILNYYE